MRKGKRLMLFVLPSLLLLLAACGTTKKVAGEKATPATTAKAKKADSRSTLAFVQKVNDNKVYAQNIVAPLEFTATMGYRDVSVSGELRMRKDKVIRLQLFVPFLGTEVGRLEFTPDYVLVVDRLHKQYLKGDYSQLDFLRNNGLDFYSLQSLFWNQLLLPGVQKVGEGDLQRFSADLSGTEALVPVSIKSGNLDFTWKAARTTGLINAAIVTYAAKSKGASTLTWYYENFGPIGSKMFPMVQEFSFTSRQLSPSKRMKVRLDMNSLKTTGGWEAETKVSPKYRKMDAKTVLDKLLNM